MLSWLTLSLASTHPKEKLTLTVKISAVSLVELAAPTKTTLSEPSGKASARYFPSPSTTSYWMTTPSTASVTSATTFPASVTLVPLDMSSGTCGGWGGHHF
jgi:hypothetical protein